MFFTVGGTFQIIPLYIWACDADTKSSAPPHILDETQTFYALKQAFLNECQLKCPVRGPCLDEMQLRCEITQQKHRGVLKLLK